MNFKKLSRAFSIAAIGLSSIFSANAQDMHFTQFNGAPMLLNPALTGAFGGSYRVTGIYRNQWSSVTTPYVTFGTSVDAPLINGESESGYLGGGLAIYNDRSGDGNLAGINGLASLAYHKFIGEDKVLSVGMQGGFTQYSIDLARLYWGDEFFNGGFQPGTTGELLKPKVAYFTANMGLGWQHRVSEKISYQLGVSAYNLNQPKVSLLQKSNNEVGLGMRISSQAGFVWDANDRLSVRPAILFQSQTAASEFIGGSEFHYVIGNLASEVRSMNTALFLGTWLRTGDAALFTVGMEHKGFRVGLGYDYNTSNLKTASGGNGGFEIAVRYVKSNEFAKRIAFPCARF